MADIFSVYEGALATIVSILPWIIPSVIIIVLFVVIAFLIRDKKLYRFPVTLVREREGGGTKETETRGGIIQRKNSAPYFVIKRGLFAKAVIYQLPQLYGMTGLDRLYYYQKNPDTYIQLKRTINKKLVDFESVESDVKYGGVLAMQRIDTITQSKSKWEKYALPIMIIVALVIIAVMFYMMLEKFDPALMAQVSENTRIAAEALARSKSG